MLRECYDQIGRVIGNNIIEPFESVDLVDSYRQYWKPENVRIVLLAESHLFTSDDARHIVIPNIPALPGYPINYARFVYCLAYGEPELTRDPNHPGNDGTPQFWKIFYSCANNITDTADFSAIQNETPFQQRINNKIAVLNAMRERGIWLVDASIIALYNRGRLYNRNLDREIIKTSWDCYTRRVITESHPHHIICIGKGVSEILEKDIRRMVNSYTVTAQPNAHLTASEHHYLLQLYSRICSVNNRGTANQDQNDDIHPLRPRNDQNLEQRNGIDELLVRAVNPNDNDIHPDGRYTHPRTYGVYDIGPNQRQRYRCGNNPIRRQELIRQFGSADVVAIFTNEEDCRRLASLLNGAN